MPMQYRYHDAPSSVRGLVNALSSIDASNQFDEKLAQTKAEADALNKHRADQLALGEKRLATQNARYNKAEKDKALLTQAMLKAMTADLNPTVQDKEVLDIKPWTVDKTLTKNVNDDILAKQNMSLTQLENLATNTLAEKELTGEVPTTALTGMPSAPEEKSFWQRGTAGSSAPITIGPRIKRKDTSLPAAPTKDMIQEEMKRIDTENQMLGQASKVERPELTLDLARKLGLTKMEDRQATAEEMQKQGIDLVNTLMPTATPEQKLGFLQAYGSRVKNITDARDKINDKTLDLQIFGAKEDKKLENKKTLEVFKASDSVKEKKPLTAKERIDLNKAIQELDDQWYTDEEEQRQIDEYKKILKQGHY